MIPDSAWNCDNRPIQGAEKKALYRVSVFVNAQAAALMRILDAQKKKDAQGQAPAVSGQICHNTVAEFFAHERFATEKYEQPHKIDRRPQVN